MGRKHFKKYKISCLVGLLNLKQGSSFAHFLHFSNALTLLTNCALEDQSTNNHKFYSSISTLWLNKSAQRNGDDEYARHAMHTCKIWIATNLK